MWGLQGGRRPFIEETHIIGLPTMISINFPGFVVNDHEGQGGRFPYEQCSKEFDAWKQASQECPFVFPVVLEKLHSEASVRMENVQTINFFDWLILLPNSKTSFLFLKQLREALDALNRVNLTWQFWTFMMKPTCEIVVLPLLRSSADECYYQGLRDEVRHNSRFPKSLWAFRLSKINQGAYNYVETCVKNKWSIVALLGVKRRRPPQLARFDKFLIRCVFGCAPFGGEQGT